MVGMESEEGLSTKEKAALRDVEANKKLQSSETLGQKIHLIDGSDLVSLYYPGKRFLVVNLHGGGFCFKNVLDNDVYCEFLRQTFGCAVLNAGFTLSYLASYPRQIQDISLEISALLSRFPENKKLPLLAVGHSSGASLAASLALRKGGEAIQGLALDYPFLDFSRDQSTRPNLPGAFPDWLLNDWISMYCPDKRLRAMPEVNPLRMSLEDTKRFPASAIVVATHDRLIEDGETLAKMLTEAKAKSKLFVVDERHGFVERNMQKIFSDPLDPEVVVTKKIVEESFGYLIDVLKL